MDFQTIARQWFEPNEQTRLRLLFLLHVMKGWYTAKELVQIASLLSPPGRFGVLKTILVLTALEGENRVQRRIVAHGGGLPRHYFMITYAGVELLEEFGLLPEQVSLRKEPQGGSLETT